MKKILFNCIFLLVIGLVKIHAQPGLIERIDSLTYRAIDSMAFPGCQILAIHKGDTLIHKSYGHHTYDENTEVKLTDLYDMASITKVTTGLPLLMKLQGSGAFDIDQPLSFYYPKFKNSDKGQLIIRDILAHQARLQPYFVYWQNTLRKNGKFKWRTFKEKPNNRYSIQITDSLYLHKKYYNKIVKTIKKSDLLEDDDMVYSGLFFLILPEIIESIIHRPFEQALYDEIYNPIGASRLLYNPLSRFELSEIPPTELDTIFRNQLIQGRVHDEAAAMLGGVSCNAGLFGNAADLAKVFTMYMNLGSYGDKNLIEPDVVGTFTSYQFPEKDNRRGLGFDKPPFEYDQTSSYISKYASPESYGHSGFTGTFVWADPTYELLVVFLSNRVYPDRSYRQLYQLNFRPKLHDLIYEYILNK